MGEAFLGRSYAGLPGHGQMKPEQLEFEGLRRKVVKLKAEHDNLKRPQLLREGRDVRRTFIAKHRGELAGGMALRSAGCVALGLPCLAQPVT
jgi:hypothetical protein